MNTGSLQGERGDVFIVLDDSAFTLELAQLLEHASLAVKTFACAREALAAVIAGARPDIIVSGLNLPDIDGHRLYRLLRSPEFEACNRLPILMLAQGHEPWIAAGLGLQAELDETRNPSLIRDHIQALLHKQTIATEVLILTADDDLTHLLERTLSRNGNNLHLVHTAQQARSIMHQHTPALVVLDQDLDGAQAFMEELLSRTPQPVLVVAASQVTPQRAVQWLSQGVYAYVSKPVAADELFGLCERARREADFRMVAAVNAAKPAAGEAYAPGVFEINGSARRLSLQILDAANRLDDPACLLKEFVTIIAGFTGCNAVGIRVLDNQGNIPYMGYCGFSDDFYRRESPLNIGHDQCMCINVITGTTDASLPFYTPGGSFYMNATTRFLATVSQQDKGRTRNVCNQVGYESVALIPIRKMDNILGLIHLADYREDKVPLPIVQVLEDVAPPMGLAIQRALVQARLKDSLEEKEVLLKEVHHRVKNNLAALHGLVNLQRQRVTEVATKAVLTDLGFRIKSMAMIYERLYRSENISRIDMQGYLTTLSADLTMAFDTWDNTRMVVTAGIPLALDLAIPCALIVNELVTNALKHAFPGGRTSPGYNDPQISVTMEGGEGGLYRLIVSDNGVGLPPGIDPIKTETLGLQLVRMLAQHQLGGTLDIDRGRGTCYNICFQAQHGVGVWLTKPS